MRLAQLRTIRSNTAQFGGTGLNAVPLERGEVDPTDIESGQAR
jgi:hypothetical protein